jgi:multicomponent Na+:H+ antiporter subunit F
MMFILTGLLICSFFCLWRVAKGPTPADRIVAVDFMGIVLVGFCAVFSLFTNQAFLIDIAISLAILGFIGTLTLAKYLEGKQFYD